MFRTLIAAALITGAGIAGAFAIASSPASASTHKVTAPHVQATVPVLHAPISEHCSTPGTYALLEGRGWPVALECVRYGQVNDWTRPLDSMPLPRWFHWGATSDRHAGPCIFAWGGSGDTSAEICRSGKAWTS